VRQTSNTSKYFVVGRLRTGVRALPPPRLWKYWKFGCLCEHAVDHPFGLGALCASVVLGSYFVVGRLRTGVLGPPSASSLEVLEVWLFV
jgi:hypothetical protein